MARRSHSVRTSQSSPAGGSSSRGLASRDAASRGARSRASQSGASVQSVVGGDGGSGSNRSGVASPAAALGVQPKLQINTPGDRYEQEADAVASAVTGGTPAPAISKLPPGGLASGVPSGASSAPAQRESLQRETAEEEPAQMQSEDEAEPVQMKENEAEPVQMAEEGESVQMAEEEEAVQMMEEKEPAQMQELEDESAQMQELEDETAQAKEGPGGSAGGGRSASAAATASRAMSQAGAGSPLPSPVRSQIEGSTGHDFSGVRVHDGAAAQSAASAINAKAFTRGNDIYLGRGASPNDTHLMAHEATHVFQQSAAPPTTSNAQRQLAQRDTIQRQKAEDEPVQMQETEEPVQLAEDDGAEGSTARSSEEGAGANGPEDSAIEVSDFKLPSFKKNDPNYSSSNYSFFRAHSYNRQGEDATTQRRHWLQNIGMTGVRDALVNGLGMNEDGIYRAYVRSDRPYVGTPETLAATELFKIPKWNEEAQVQNRRTPTTIDHIVELQIGGWPRDRRADSTATLDNYQVLDASTNQSSGGKIMNEVRSAVERTARAEAEDTESPIRDAIAELDLEANMENLRRSETSDIIGVRDVNILNFATGDQVTPEVDWSKEDIQTGKQVDALVSAGKSGRDVRIQDLSNLAGDDTFDESNVRDVDAYVGSATRRVLYTTNGLRLQPLIDWPEGENVATNLPDEFHNFKGMKLSRISWDASSDNPPAGGTPIGYFAVEIFSEQSEQVQSEEGSGASMTLLWPLLAMPNMPYAAQFDPDVRSALNELGAKNPFLSPVVFTGIDMVPDQGLVARAYVDANLPIIRGQRINILLEGDDLRAETTFSAGELSLPGPAQFTEGSLTVSLGVQSGVSVTGRAGFEVEDVGTGYLEGGASTEEGFHVAGGFDFDTELFSEASIDLGYHKAPDKEAVFTGSGTLAIGRSKVKGIKSASIDVTVENDSWTADGTVEPEINGIREGTLTAAYAPETGFAIDGSLSLSEDVPGIRGGTLDAGVRKRESGDGYKIRASGEADLDIPGVSSRIGVTYDDGLFTAQTTVGYERGMLSGRLTAGITNQPLGDDGQPAGGEDAADPGNDLRAFGGGEMTLGLAPWLQATAGVQLLPNGDVEMRGEIGIPEVIELFPERRYERRLFTVGLDIPIVGVAVAGQRIGIFATVNGGLDATASIGPGELRDANLAVEYNPDREDETTVTGHALFVIPAFAGLRLFVRGGLGAGIPIVSAEAGLEVGGQIGLEGAAEAEADVNWNPQSGLALHAEGRIFAEPSFLFDVSGYANVSANLVFTTVDLYDERFTLASYEWGSGMRVGVIFPVDYREGEPFSLSTDDIEFVYPEINPRAIITDLVDEVA